MPQKFWKRAKSEQPSSKGREYKLSQIKDMSQRLYSRLLRKNGAIEDLLYSSKDSDYLNSAKKIVII